MKTSTRCISFSLPILPVFKQGSTGASFITPTIIVFKFISSGTLLRGNTIQRLSTGSRVNCIGTARKGRIANGICCIGSRVVELAATGDGVAYTQKDLIDTSELFYLH
ncbi:MAG: hypothetical protein ABIN01_17325 [Ferruginibacter sp.]